MFGRFGTPVCADASIPDDDGVVLCFGRPELRRGVVYIFKVDRHGPSIAVGGQQTGPRGHGKPKELGRNVPEQ